MLVLALIFLMILLLAYRSTQKPTNFPPGPKWLPFVGSAHHISALRKKTGHLLLATAEMARQYGPVVGLKVGNDLVVMVHGMKALKEFLLNEDICGRPNTAAYTFRSYGKRLGIALTDGDFWTEQRRFLVRHLREFGFGTKDMSTLVETEVHDLVRYLDQKTDREDTIVNMQSLFNTPILNTLWTMLTGVRYEIEDPKLMEMHKIVGEMLKQISMVGKAFSFFPFLRYVAPEASGYNVYMEAHKRLLDLMYMEMQYHKKTLDPENPRDVMDLYINAINENYGSTFTEQQLLVTCMDMFVAGTETTSNTLSFCFLYLVLYPEVQRKAREEIDAVLGRERSPTLSDRHRLPYVECVVQESLRMFTGKSFTLPHRTMKDTYLCGYYIPKNVRVVGNFYDSLIGPDSGLDDPEEFRPERYLKDGQIVVPDNILPFGLGKRRCIGDSLAKANIFLFVTALLQRFTFSVVSDKNTSTMEWEEAFTPQPKPFNVLVRKR